MLAKTFCCNKIPLQQKVFFMPLSQELFQKGMTPLPVTEVKQALANEATILLDTRSPEIFIHGFIPGSINIGLDARFAEWAGNLIALHTPLILVAEPGREKESLSLLADAGFQNFLGYAEGGLEAWQQAGEETDLIIEVEADELAMDIPFDEKLLVLDVRKPAEFAEGHIKNAINLPLEELNDVAAMASIEEDQNVYIHSGNGYRSVIALSLLKRQGLHNLRHVMGGWGKIKLEGRIETEKDKNTLN